VQFNKDFLKITTMAEAQSGSTSSLKANVNPLIEEATIKSRPKKMLNTENNS
jgi:hypothetical protein